MGSVDSNLYEFGEFRLDARESVLARGEELIILPPKVFETLALLVKKQGGIVSKTEMLDTIWADSFVEESNLTQNIYTLRKVLGKDAGGKQIIETVARRGYRIAVPVTKLTTAGGTNQNSFAPENASDDVQSSAFSLNSNPPENPDRRRGGCSLSEQGRTFAVEAAYFLRPRDSAAPARSFVRSAFSP